MTWSARSVLRVQCDIVSIIMKFMKFMVRMIRIFVCSGILTAECPIGGGLPQRRSGQSSYFLLQLEMDGMLVICNDDNIFMGIKIALKVLR